jgi:hypothetical protein
MGRAATGPIIQSGGPSATGVVMAAVSSAAARATTNGGGSGAAAGEQAINAPIEDTQLLFVLRP